MTSRPHKPVALLATVLFTVLLLPFLAVLQYRWIGEVSRASRDRMRAQLERDLSALNRDLDVQIASTATLPPDDKTAKERKAGIHGRILQWADALPNPNLIAAAYLVRRSGRDLTVERVDRAHRKFEQLPIPQGLAPLLRSLNPGVEAVDRDLPARAMPLGPPGAPSVRIQKPEPRHQKEGGDPEHRFRPPPGFPGEFERHGPPPRGPDHEREGERDGFGPRPRFRFGPPPEEGRLGRRPGEGLRPGRGAPPIVRPVAPVDYWLVSVFDTGYIGRKLVPDLIEQRLGPPADYLIRIAGAQGVVWESGHLDNEDARAELFALPASYSRTQPMGESGASLWQIGVRHRAGPLEQIVAKAQQRDLAISFVILCILGASIGVLVLLTRRTARLARMQMDFVAGVSHELRTPLAVVNSAADNLAAGIVGKDSVPKYGEVIRRETGRLARMVENVLAFSRAEHAQAPHSPEAVDVGHLVQRAVAGCAPELRDAQCSVQIEMGPDLPPVLGDAAWLEHCLRNLIGNAAKYAAEGKRVEVRAHADGGSAVLQVQDHGRGISRENHKRIFEPFFRCSEVVEAQLPGSGIGLSIVKRIVEAHRGTITVESQPGQGATFTLRLPFAPVESVRSQSATRMEAETVQ